MDDLQGLRVGVDLMSVDDVDAAITRFGDRYIRRVFTAHEIESCCRGSRIVSEGLAARFAAKEAAIKVLQPKGIQPDYRSIEVRRHEEGRCELVLTGTAAEMAKEQGLGRLALSITHEAGMAAAVVVAVCIN